MTTTAVEVPVANPSTSLPVAYRQSATDADNHGVATVAAISAQDQISLTRQVQAVLGLRYDNFSVDFMNNRTGMAVSSVDGLVSPRVGLITRPSSATAQAGASLAQLPAHSFSLWNKYGISRTWGAGLGVTHRGDVFTSTDNTVTLPSFVRTDAAVFYSVSRRMRGQLNVENLFDASYYPSAHSDTNITPGSPRSVRLSLTTQF